MAISMNALLELIPVMRMRHVQTTGVHTHVLVIMDTPVMVSTVLISTNVCPILTIDAMSTLVAPILTDHMTALVTMVTVATVSHVLILTNVPTVIMTVILTQLAGTTAVVSLVLVTMDIAVMAIHVLMLMSVPLVTTTVMQTRHALTLMGALIALAMTVTKELARHAET